jgi:hypothetical protein
MKNLLLFKLLLTATIANSQASIQPISSGDYWEIDEFQNRLPELANKTTFPTTVSFTNGSAFINSFYVNKLIGANEIVWNTGVIQNAENFVVEWSRDLKTFERAGIVQFMTTEGASKYSFRHQFEASPLVYYRLGIVTSAKTIAYTPAVQVMDEEHSTKVFPTVVKGSTLYIQTGKAYEKMQVINTGNLAVFEKGINGVTGTITIGLPPLPKGIYFVRLLSTNQPQHVEKILVE